MLEEQLEPSGPRIRPLLRHEYDRLVDLGRFEAPDEPVAISSLGFDLATKAAYRNVTRVGRGLRLDPVAVHRVSVPADEILP